MTHTSGDFNWLKKHFFCTNKMYLISEEGYENARAHILTIKKMKFG